MKAFTWLKALLMLAVFATFSTSRLAALTFETIYTFTGGTDGGSPVAGLIPDDHGNLFGVTQGTQTNSGTVFELSPMSGGGWTVKTLYTFQGGTDGDGPVGTLVFDKHGNLFGTTVFGGVGTSTVCINRCGTVFELSPNGSGAWNKTEVYQFQGGSDGASPTAGMVMDGSGNLFGTTSFGGGSCDITFLGCGTAFELSPGDGGWTESILHHFGQGNCPTCLKTPEGALVFDAQGDLYGTTFVGGSSNCGGVFKLTPVTGGGWKTRVQHTFTCGNDGAYPNSTLVFDGVGRLYGTTQAGGKFNNGVVYWLPVGGGSGAKIHDFNGADGSAPSTVTLDSAGNIYGTTGNGGGSANCTDGCGVAYKLTIRSSNSWTYSMLHSFTGPDGQFPNALFLNSAGDLLGTTSQGGADSFGTVFEIKP